ncbi:MAG: hypothetical protein CMC55_08560 [Flavobacteriaceae bacterium]|nr:hypothetical protein [Flavobacteriaceae bacterium]
MNIPIFKIGQQVQFILPNTTVTAYGYIYHLRGLKAWIFDSNYKLYVIKLNNVYAGDFKSHNKHFINVVYEDMLYMVVFTEFMSRVYTSVIIDIKNTYRVNLKDDRDLYNKLNELATIKYNLGLN